ncbi:hypothetical protein [Xanthomonas euvesicatoria]|nr:hypothetical protein [Xanthomonas euvesicatoria]MBV6805218.1 hypothetical protein [Xanthomonas campestris pv. convolvuli]
MATTNANAKARFWILRFMLSPQVLNCRQGDKRTVPMATEITLSEHLQRDANDCAPSAHSKLSITSRSIIGSQVPPSAHFDG